MKKTKTEQMSAGEATKKIAELHEKLRKIAFGMAGSRTKNVKEVGNMKKEIARLETMKSAQK
ncbi:MAG: 50S ribosomal protein L29 [Candidatus Pacebacteria bacterium]|nr:50S ribosomal protein L29 [Candidatus Paceibacterota bacterium]